MISEITSLTQFHDVMKRSSVTPMVVAAYADWAGPWRTMKPAYEGISENEGKSKATFYKFDIDKQTQVATELGVNSVPIVYIIKDGNIINSVAGANPGKLTSIIVNL